MHHTNYNVMQHIIFRKFPIILSLTLLNAVCPWFCCVVLFMSLVMAPKVGWKFKTRANRNPGSSFSGSTLVDRVRFLSAKFEKTYKTLTKYRSIWGEREVVLSELDPSIRRNFVSKNWISLCVVFDPPLTALIREFYKNLFVYSEVIGGHYLTSWIQGQKFTITKQTV